jgi:hypothetical protein
MFVYLSSIVIRGIATKSAQVSMQRKWAPFYCVLLISRCAFQGRVSRPSKGGWCGASGERLHVTPNARVVKTVGMQPKQPLRMRLRRPALAAGRP